MKIANVRGSTSRETRNEEPGCSSNPSSLCPSNSWQDTQHSVGNRNTILSMEASRVLGSCASSCAFPSSLFLSRSHLSPPCNFRGENDRVPGLLPLRDFAHFGISLSLSGGGFGGIQFSTEPIEVHFCSIRLVSVSHLQENI